MANEIRMTEMHVEHAVITVEGKSDLIINKMNASATRQLLSDDRKAAKLVEDQHKNKWEDIITSIHWRDPLPVEDTNIGCTEELLRTLLKENAPCISALGFKKSWNDAVVWFGIDQYKTKFNAAVNIVVSGGKVPIKFSEHFIQDLVIPGKGKRGTITARLNHFTGWSAEIPIEYTTNVYSLNEIVAIINSAGFSIGIGSGRTSGYGRYAIVDVK